MPAWKIHNKWAEKLGISKEVSNYVNTLVDFPEKHKEFMKFFTETSNWFSEWKKINPKFPLTEDYMREIISTKDEFHNRMLRELLQIKHDAGRRKNPLRGSRYQGLAAFVQLKFLSLKGSDYIKAWYLHHFIDFTVSSPLTDIKEKIKRIKERTQRPKFTEVEFEEVAKFFEKNFTEIVKDIKNNKQQDSIYF